MKNTSHWLIQQNGYLLNIGTGEYLRDINGQPIWIDGTIRDAAAYVENVLGGTWEAE